MQLKLACADFTFPILPHEQALAIISMLGLKGVDIALFEDRSHLQPSSEFENVRRSGRALGQKLGDNGLVAADLFLQLALDYESHAVNHPQPERRARAPRRLGHRLRRRVRRQARHRPARGLLQPRVEGGFHRSCPGAWSRRRHAASSSP